MSGQGEKTNTALEQKNRKLEQAEVDTLLRDDMAAVRSNWAKDYFVNNPFNVVVDASKGPIQARTLKYSSFIREIERVVIHSNTVIVMGRETVVQKELLPTLARLFTASLQTSG